uniref:Uncharacterized protein n=1 Tax=Arundo donax TaxID=35708 RepID=A0A0A9A0G9_ARUDO
MVNIVHKKARWHRIFQAKAPFSLSYI